jgi:hypothetical protein
MFLLQTWWEEVLLAIWCNPVLLLESEGVTDNSDPHYPMCAFFEQGEPCEVS